MINLSNGYSVPADSPKFEPGDVIFHKKYGYRGIVVDFDITCQAPDSWYQSNLVYDQLEKPVIHAMLNLFFSGHDEENNKYLRNTIPWDPGNPPDAPPPTPPPDFTPPAP